MPSRKDNIFDFFARSYRRSDPEILEMIISNRPKNSTPQNNLPNEVIELFECDEI